MIFVPFKARAENENSQNLPLLQANVSPASVATKTDDSSNSAINSDALKPNTSQMVIAGGPEGDVSSEDNSVYVVREGDKIADIAKMFNLSANTILWANNMKKGDKLSTGDILLIPPADGLMVTVTKGMTLGGLSKKYNVDKIDIASFNGIAQDSDLTVGDEIFIPDGVMMSDEGGSKPKNSKTDKKYYESHKLPAINGYFMNPMPEARLTQGLHDHGGIDLAKPIGASVYAAASGSVIFARYGYNGGYGNLIIISHPNGTTSLYGHLSKVSVSVGDHVSQGEQIGAEGNSGHSTGPHLHFKITGAQNPGAFLPVGSTPSADWK